MQELGSRRGVITVGTASAVFGGIWRYWAVLGGICGTNSNYPPSRLQFKTAKSIKQGSCNINVASNFYRLCSL